MTCRRAVRLLSSALLFMLCCAAHVATEAQTAAPQTSAPSAKRQAARRPSKLPGADRIISDHVKRIGGRKRLLQIADAIYEWGIADAARTAPAGTARLMTKRPGALRLDLNIATAQGMTTPTLAVAAGDTPVDTRAAATTFAATDRLAWLRVGEEAPRTLVDRRSSSSRLIAALFADRLFDYKRANALARTLARDDETFARTHTEAAYLVEFTHRDNTRVRAWFGAESRCLLRLAGADNYPVVTFHDYRVPAGSTILSEPHRIEIDTPPGEAATASAAPLVLILRAARYNTSLADSIFDAPPAADVSLDALLREVTRRQRRADSALDYYTYRVRRGETTLGKGGVIDKTSSTTWEVFVAKNGAGAAKRVLVDDRPLTPAEAAKEDAKLVARLEELEKPPPPAPKPTPEKTAEQKEEEQRSGGFALNIGDFRLRLTDIMRISEFVSPRRELFRGRECVVFDFQPRKGFRPKSREEEAINKLRGVMWIDTTDKLVTRFEARLTESFKIGGGLLASIRPGAALVYEAQRLPEGLWMPRFFRFNASGRALFFAEINELATTEWSDFKRFRTSTDEGIITPPTITSETQP